MEADWAAEVGPDLPVIDADWPGLIDLRQNPEHVNRIDEAGQHSAVRQALLRLNARESPVRTAKCDVWILGPGEIDPLEFGCALNQKLVGVACYIDLLAINDAVFASFEQHEHWAAAAVRHMRQTHSAPGRVDLVIRAAHAAGCDGFGLTLYAAGCGADADAAEATFRAILSAATAITMNAAPSAGASSSIG